MSKNYTSPHKMADSSPAVVADAAPVTKSMCRLFAVTQYECAYDGRSVECYPFERIFRQCANGPALEVTNRVIGTEDGKPVIDPVFLANPPKGKKWDGIF